MSFELYPKNDFWPILSDSKLILFKTLFIESSLQGFHFKGMDWTLREGYSWAEDKEHCEEYGYFFDLFSSFKNIFTGRMLQADASKVSTRAKKRGLPQV